MKTAVVLVLLAAATLGRSAELSPGVKVVTELYREYAWEMTIAEPIMRGSVYEAPREKLERYFSAEIASLIVRDRECAERLREICRINFSILWDSQDSGAYDIKIKDGGAPDTVLVSYVYPGTGEEVQLTYWVAREASGEAKIADIRYRDGSSLRAILSAEIDESK
jgi:hypothetical protein